MKTKTNAPKVDIDANEPTDAELRAIEHDNEEHAGDEQGDDAYDDDAGSENPAAAHSGMLNLVGSTPIDLARLGLNKIAYLRQTKVDDQLVWSIFSASGHPLGAALTLEQAWGAVMQNELQPVHVH